MKKAVIDFWNYIIENLEIEVVEEYAESYEIDVSKITTEHLSTISEKETEELLGCLAELYMDVSGNDNYGEIFDLIFEITEIDERKLARILELDNEDEDPDDVQEYSEDAICDWKYSVLDDDSLRLDDYIGSDEEIIIPSKISGKIVTEIGEGVLDADNINFSSTRKISAKQKKVRNHITRIVLPDTIVKVGKYAFRMCSVKEVKLSDNITEIGDGAFANCKSLEKIEMPSVLKTIGKEAFSGIHKIDKWFLPEGLEKIGAGAFVYSSMSEIHIPSSVNEIGDSAIVNWANDGMTIFCAPGSAAERFAKNAKIQYENEGEPVDLLLVESQKNEFKKESNIITEEPVPIEIIHRQLKNAVIGDNVTMGQWFINDDYDLKKMFKSFISWAGEEAGLKSFNSVKGDGYPLSMGEWLNDEKRVKDNIKWKILDICDNKALLISEGIIAEKSFNTQINSEVDWEICELRSWLSEEFYEIAFSEEEKAMIIGSTVPNDSDIPRRWNNYDSTIDKVFILSRKELEYYSDANDAGKVLVDKMIHPYTEYFWVRTPGKRKTDLTVSSYAGVFIDDDPASCQCNSEYHGVRAAMWVQL